MSTCTFPCPKCAYAVFQRGYVLVCDSCGWDSQTGCGADGFELPTKDSEYGDEWDEDDEDDLYFRFFGPGDPNNYEHKEEREPEEDDVDCSDDEADCDEKAAIMATTRRSNTAIAADLNVI